MQDALKEDEQGRYGRIQQVFEQLKTEWSPCDLTGVLYHIAIPSDPSDERAILVVEMGSVLSDALKRCCCYEIVRLLKAKPQFENDVIYRARLADECVERCEPLQEVIRSRMKLGDTMLECAIPIIAKLKNPADVPLFASILEDLLTIEAEGEFGLRELVVYLDNYGQQGQFAIRDIARRQGDKSLLRLLRDAVENTLGDDDETRGALPEVFAE